MTSAQSRRSKVSDGTARALLFFYKRVIGPAVHAAVPGACRFQPTCSEYAAIAVAEHGVLRGGRMAAWRVLRCHPFHRGGFDPVPAKRTVQGTLAAQSRN
jgi:uncharacterized protein